MWDTLACIVVLLAACGGAPAASTGVSSVDPCADFLCIQYDGRRYVGHQAESVPTVAKGRGSLWIADGDLTKIGIAAEVNKEVGPDLTVYSVANVDPALAVVTYDGPAREVTVWTVDGLDPATIPGLCAHYLDPALRMCQTIPSPWANS